MNEKLEESAQYLKCCINIETENFRLNEILSKKVNNPESSFIIGFAYDSLKCTKTIQALLENFDLPQKEDNCKKNLSALSADVAAFSKRISKINNINPDTFGEILKELTAMTDRSCEVYNEFLQSSGPRTLADELSKIATVDLENFKKIFEGFIETKEKQREIIVGIMYHNEAKEADRLKHITPVIKYQNPDSWIRRGTVETPS
jgi:hypothetical protein